MTIPPYAWWIITGLISMLVIVIWWAAVRFITTTVRQLKEQSESISLQYSSIKVLHEQIEGLRRVYDKDFYNIVDRLNSHAKDIQGIRSKVIRQDAVLEGLKSVTKKA